MNNPGTANKLVGDYIHTFTGKHFYAADPQVDQIDVRDIAHALSLTCRFGGHSDEHYSVAQHCVILSYLVSEENALWGLLHDASEAYLGDMPKPFKRMMPDYNALEDKVQQKVIEAFDLTSPMPDEIHIIDSKIVVNEATDLFKDTVAWTSDNEMLYTKGTHVSDSKNGEVLRISPWSAKRSENAFLLRYQQLQQDIEPEEPSRIILL